MKLIQNKDFLSIWFIGLTHNILKWLEILAVGVVVFEITDSPFYVAMMVILRFMPLTIFGFLNGIIAERINRRKALFYVFLSMAVCSLSYAVLIHFGMVNLWLIALSVITNGFLWALDFPLRRTLFADVLSHEQLGKAITLDSVTNNFTRFLGPIFGGFFVEYVGLKGIFILGTVLYSLSAMVALRGIRNAGEPLKMLHEKYLSSIKNGIDLLFRVRVLLGIMLITLIYNLWGFPFVSMIPVIGKDILTLSPFSVGLLASSEGLGALTGAFLILTYANEIHYRKLFVLGTLLSILMALCFSHASQFLIAVIFLFFSGIGAGCFSAMQSTLVILCSPKDARARMMGLLTVFIGLATLGFIKIGLFANWLGAQNAIFVCSVEGLIVLVLVVKFVPEIFYNQHHSSESPLSSGAPR